MKKLFRIFALMAVSVMMFTACSSSNKGNEVKDYTSEELAQIINDCGGEWAESFPAAEIETDFVKEFYSEFHGWDYSKIATGASSFSQFITHAYSVTIIKPADGSTDDVKSYFENYRDAMVANFENYLIDQYDIAKATIIEEVNGYVVMVMAEDARSIYNAISERL